MNLFSISELQQFSGIKAHTIRAWEQRYNVLTPIRSEGNTRYYSNDQLRRLLNIVSLLDSGYKISELCAMNDQMLFKLLGQQLKESEGKDIANEYYVSQLVLASTNMDEPHFEKIFSNCVLRLGLKDTYTKIIYPLINRLGLMWAMNAISPAYEHFSSNIIEQKLFAAIDALPPANSEETWLLFLPENEFHEIGLILSNYLIRSAGKKVIYLGSNLPFDTLIGAVMETKPHNIFLFLVHNDNPSDTQDYLNRLKMKISSTKIHFSGSEKLIDKLNTGVEVNWIRSVEELEKQLI